MASFSYRAGAPPNIVAVAVQIVVLGSLVFHAARPVSAVEIISITRSGEAGEAAHPRLDGSGRYVVFSSVADDLVEVDDNGRQDIFVRDRLLATTERVNVGPLGQQDNVGSRQPDISGDGNIVVFTSGATNFFAPISSDQIYARDRARATTELVSVDSQGFRIGGGSIEASVNGDGRFVALQAFTVIFNVPMERTLYDIYRRDRTQHKTAFANLTFENHLPELDSGRPRISSDGNSVSFASYSPDIVADDRNEQLDVFVRDLGAGTTKRASVASDGGESDGESFEAWLSGDGHYVAFSSGASNLVARPPCHLGRCYGVYLHDNWSGTTELVSLSDAGEPMICSGPSMSSDARFVVFGCDQIYVRDRQAQRTILLSKSAAGTPAVEGTHAEPAISADGKVAAFISDATDLVGGTFPRPYAAVAVSVEDLLKPCAGDCNLDGVVETADISAAVGSALSGRRDACVDSDLDGDARLTVNELVTYVRRKLEDCRWRS